jgi:pSer/pThr/pTyr-binding forkhead associated (FHA) protein
MSASWFPRRWQQPARPAQPRGLCTLVLKQGREPADGKSHTMGQVRHEQPPATAEFWLRDREGIYPLKAGVNTIGRHPDNDVVLQGTHVSRRHCAILVHVGGCALHDLASRNGAYVNGVKVNGSTHLVPGDEICICCRRFVFLSKDGTPISASPQERL